MKTLVVYFSQTGVTKKSAQQIAKLLSADIAEIKTEKTYPDSYVKTLAVSAKEFVAKEDVRLSVAPDPADYDNIAIGFPVWYGVCPMAIVSYLKKFDFTGKTIYPFATSGGSLCVKSTKTIANTVNGATVKDGEIFNVVSAERINEWFNK